MITAPDLYRERTQAQRIWVTHPGLPSFSEEQHVTTRQLKLNWGQAKLFKIASSFCLSCQETPGRSQPSCSSWLTLPRSLRPRNLGLNLLSPVCGVSVARVTSCMSGALTFRPVVIWQVTVLLALRTPAWLTRGQTLTSAPSPHSPAITGNARNSNKKESIRMISIR